MSSLRYRAAHAFLQQHAGKSKQELLVEIAKIPNSDLVNDLLYYLVHNTIPNENPVKLRRVLNNDLKRVLFKHNLTQFLHFHIVGSQTHATISAWCHQPGKLMTDRFGFTSTHNGILFDQPNDRFVDIADNFPYCFINFDKIIDPIKVKLLDIDTSELDLFDESILPSVVIQELEEKKIISPSIEVPREYVNQQ